MTLLVNGFDLIKRGIVQSKYVYRVVEVFFKPHEKNLLEFRIYGEMRLQRKRYSKSRSLSKASPLLGVSVKKGRKRENERARATALRSMSDTKYLSFAVSTLRRRTSGTRKREYNVK